MALTNTTQAEINKILLGTTAKLWDFDTILKPEPLTMEQVNAAAKAAFVAPPEYVTLTGYVTANETAIDPLDVDLRRLDAEAWDMWRARYPQRRRIGYLALADGEHKANVEHYLEDPVNQANVRTILKGAADALRVHGWGQGALRSRTGRLCAMGAALTAAKETEVDLAAVIPAVHLLERAMPRHLQGKSVVAFNDTDAQRPDHVIALIDRALTLLDTY